MNVKHIITPFLSAIVLAIAPLAMADVDSNSIIKDDIEYYFQTDKAIYNLVENVEMLYRVTNMRDANVTFEFFAGPADDRCDFMVDKDGQRIWDNVHRPSSDVITHFTLAPSESKNFSWSWNMTNFNKEQIMPGYYDVTGALSDLSLAYIEYHVPVSVSIDIIPEPASMLMFGTGTIILLACNRRKPE